MEFDVHASDYQKTLDRSLAFSGEGSAYFARRKAQRVEELARGLNPQGRARVLDVGCGIGLVLETLDRRAIAPEGTDVSGGMLESAQKRLPDVAFTACSPDGALPYPDAVFDLTFTACTLHHVPVSARPAFMASLARVTRPGGLVVVFEHNPWNPVTRAIVAGCEFDRDAVLLGAAEVRTLMRGAGLRPRSARYYLFVPPRLHALTFLERYLEWLPLGGQYFVVGEVPR